MARPIDTVKRKKIAREAFNVIKAHGVRKTTMSDIAKALGMKRPTLYWYFPDLGALCDAVLTSLQDETLTHVTQSMGAQSHPIDQLDALVTAAVGFYEERREDLLAVLQLWAISSGDPERLTQRERELAGPQREFLVQIIEYGITHGRIEPCDAQGLADMALTLVTGSHFQRVAHNSDLGALVQFFRHHVLAPLRIPRKEIL